MIDIAAVYAQVPDVGCKGLCGRACGPVACTATEVDAMVADGVLPPAVRVHPKHGPYTCSHLTDDDRCAIYARRPLVCRLFGAIRALRCPHGCRPDAGFMAPMRAAGLVHALKDNRPDHHSAPEARDLASAYAQAADMFDEHRAALAASPAARHGSALDGDR